MMMSAPLKIIAIVAMAATAATGAESVNTRVEIVLPVFEDIANEAAQIALEVAGTKPCKKAFMGINPRFDAVKWMLDGELVVAQIGQDTARVLGFPVSGVSSCSAPRRIGLSGELLKFLGPAHGAEVLIHEISHFASCGIAGMTREISESNAKKVTKACFAE